MRISNLRSTMFAGAALALPLMPAGCDLAQVQAEAKQAQAIAVGLCGFEPAIPMLINLINAGAGATAETIGGLVCQGVNTLPRSTHLRGVRRGQTFVFNGHRIPIEGRFVRPLQ